MIPLTATAPDGTVLSAWRNSSDGPAVVLSNGLGAPPEAWPGLTDDDSGFSVVGWHHRGLGGSARPADPSRITVEDHAEDLVAVMDAARVHRALLVGWSVGVGAAFEVALRHPERVAGVLAVAGVPGGSFSALFGPVLMPRRLRPRAGRLAARALAHVGPAVRVAAEVLAPVGGHARDLVRPSSYAVASGHALRAFAGHDWRWYSELVRASEQHGALDLRALSCPTTFVAGRFDLITAADAVRRAAGRVPGARYVELPGSHYLPLEFPGAIKRELAVLSRRADPPPDQI